MTINPILEESLIIRCARKVIDYIDEIKNTEIDERKLSKLRTSLQLLVEACDSKPLEDFPVKIIDEPIDNVQFQIRSTYSWKLNFSDVPKFVIDGLGQSENMMEAARCLDALGVLVDYCNILVYSRSARCLKLEPKKLDDWNELSSAKSGVIGDQ